MRTRPSTLCIVTLFLGYALLAYLFPWKHSPDANVYYAVALRLMQGDVLRAFEGMHSPFLSWLIAVPGSLGVPLPVAMRFLSVLCFGGYLLAARRALCALNCSPPVQVCVLALTSLQMVFVIVRYPTPDLLAATFSLWSLALMLEAKSAQRKLPVWLLGVLIGLTYYTKAFQSGVIALWGVALVGRSHFRQLLGSLAIAALMCAPLITALSLHYGTFTVSAQQFLLLGNQPLSFTPMAQTHIETSSLEIVRAIIRHAAFKVSISAEALTQGVRDFIMGPEALYLYLAALLVGFTVTIRGANSSAAIVCLIQVCALMLIWGGRVRYYFAVIPLLTLCAGWGIARCAALVSRTTTTLSPLRATAILVACWTILTAATTYSTFRDEWNTTSNAAIRAAAHHPRIIGQQGVMATCDVQDQLSPLVAAYAKRTMWIYLNAYPTLSPAALAELLLSNKVTQVLVAGAIPDYLNHVPQLLLKDTFTEGATTFTLFEFDVIAPLVPR